MRTQALPHTFASRPASADLAFLGINAHRMANFNGRVGGEVVARLRRRRSAVTVLADHAMTAVEVGHAGAFAASLGAKYPLYRAEPRAVWRADGQTTTEAILDPARASDYAEAFRPSWAEIAFAFRSAVEAGRLTPREARRRVRRLVREAGGVA